MSDNLRVYDLEMTIYTVSGHKYTASLNFKEQVHQGKLNAQEAMSLLEKVESDLKNRTFQRPINYSDFNSETGGIEYFFNPANVECIGIVRKF